MTTTPYATVADAATFWAEYPSIVTTAWNALSSADKLSYLVMATKKIDSLRLQGYKLLAAQTNQFPRKYQIDPRAYSPWGILMIFLDPFGYWYPSNDILSPYYPSGYWVVGHTYVIGNIIFDTTVNKTFQCILGHVASALDEPDLSVNYATYWTVISGFPKDVVNACCLEAKAIFDLYGGSDPTNTETSDRAELQRQGVQSASYGNTSETYVQGARTMDEGFRSRDAYDLIEKYIEKSTNII